MKRTDWQIERDYEEMVYNDDLLLDFVEDDALIEWVLSDKDRRKEFISYLRAHKETMKNWTSYVSEIVNEECYGYDEDMDRDR